MIRFLLLILTITSCSTSHYFKKIHTKLDEKIMLREGRLPIRGVSMVVHGLNTNPHQMENLTAVLQDLHQDVYFIRLSGHRNSMEEFQKVSRDIWLNQLEEAYQIAKRRASNNQVPLNYLGFSLGGLLNLDMMSAKRLPYPAFNKMILFAPAITVTWYTNLLKTLFVFHDTSLFPAPGTDDGMAYLHAPVGGYRGMFDSINALKDAQYKFINVPTLVFMHHKDEAVNFRGIQGVIEDYHLTKWKLVPIDNGKEGHRGNNHHVIVQEKQLGAQGWKNVKKRIKAFLQ